MFPNDKLTFLQQLASSHFFAWWGGIGQSGPGCFFGLADGALEWQQQLDNCQVTHQTQLIEGKNLYCLSDTNSLASLHSIFPFTLIFLIIDPVILPVLIISLSSNFTLLDWPFLNIAYHETWIVKVLPFDCAWFQYV
jgi:hypothetical protein